MKLYTFLVLLNIALTGYCQGTTATSGPINGQWESSQNSVSASTRTTTTKAATLTAATATSTSRGARATSTRTNTRSANIPVETRMSFKLDDDDVELSGNFILCGIASRSVRREYPPRPKKSKPTPKDEDEEDEEKEEEEDKNKQTSTSTSPIFTSASGASTSSTPTKTKSESPSTTNNDAVASASATPAGIFDGASRHMANYWNYNGLYYIETDNYSPYSGFQAQDKLKVITPDERGQEKFDTGEYCKYIGPEISNINCEIKPQTDNFCQGYDDENIRFGWERKPNDYTPKGSSLYVKFSSTAKRENVQVNHHKFLNFLAGCVSNQEFTEYHRETRTKIYTNAVDEGKTLPLVSMAAFFNDKFRERVHTLLVSKENAGLYGLTVIKEKPKEDKVKITSRYLAIYEFINVSIEECYEFDKPIKLNTQGGTKTMYDIITEYFNKFGSVPIITYCLDGNDENLYVPRFLSTGASGDGGNTAVNRYGVFNTTKLPEMYPVLMPELIPKQGVTGAKILLKNDIYKDNSYSVNYKYKGQCTTFVASGEIDEKTKQYVSNIKSFEFKDDETYIAKDNGKFEGKYQPTKIDYIYKIKQ